MNTLPQNPGVVVVGAGVAGLAAAKSLRDAGFDVVVLEAAGHSGGRCVTDTSTFSVPFDRGGSWLHSAPINPLARLAEGRGKTLHKEPWTWSKVQVQGDDLSASEVADFARYQDRMWHAIEQRGAVDPDTTTRSAMPEGPWIQTAVCSIPQMLAGDADVTSVRDSFNYANASGDWLVEGGLGEFVQELHQGVPVLLNCPVSRIDYSGTGVKVTCAQGTLSAKHLVLTVSTGVLAADRIGFVPPLPVSKSTAIDKLPNGLLNKIGIEFDPVWKDAVQGEIVDYHSSGNEFCSLLFGFFDTSLAVGFVAGRFADALEQQGPGAATEFCLGGLRAIFGHSVIKSIRRTDETAWRSDTHALGSYSYAKPGGSDARRELAEPLADRIFFAGEATMTDTYSTVHGAYLSGQKAAEMIVSMQHGLSPRGAGKTVCSSHLAGQT